MAKIKKSITLSAEANQYVIEIASLLSKRLKSIFSYSETIDLIILFFNQKIRSQEFLDEFINFIKSLYGGQNE